MSAAILIFGRLVKLWDGNDRRHRRQPVKRYPSDPTSPSGTRPKGFAHRLGMAACLALVSGSSLAAIGVTTVPSLAAGVTSSVLILGDTVSGATSSLEAQEVVAQGLTPVVVDSPTWSSMSTAQFASYRAIVLGDPTCVTGTASIAAAIANAPTWGAAVNGNVLLIGTDPVYHAPAQPGALALVQRGIDFTVAQAGKTGAYIDLSCYYAGAAAHTPLPLLDGIRPGGFTVSGEAGSLCFNDAHIVATHPALTGLTDAGLSNWSCSVHEAFDSWPADFAVLVIAKNLGSSYTASDGTVGTPYILASGSGLHSFPLSLDPLSQTIAVGTRATVTAQLLDASTGLPVSGTAISFRVSTGPNSGASGPCGTPGCLTNALGQVTWTYSGALPGTDTIQAWLDSNHDGVPSVGEPQTTALVTYTTPRPATIILGPTTQTVRPGGEADLTAQVLSNAGFPVAGITVHFTVVSGPDAGTASSTNAPSGPDGYTHFAYDALGIGLDTVKATVNTGSTTLTSNTVTVRVVQSDPLQTIGLLTTKDPSGQRHTCTAAVIASYNQSTIVTAAHCAYGSGDYFSDFAFAPAFSGNVDKCGSSRACKEPFGVWTGVGPYVDPHWISSADPSYDFAFIVMQTNAGVPIDRAVGGGLSVSFASDPKQPWTAYGYPGSPTLRNCTANTASTTSVGSGPDNFVMPCNMNGDWRNADEGASGGPWLTRGDQIGAVNSTSVSCRVYALHCTKELRGAQFQSAAESIWWEAINDYGEFVP